MNKMNMRYMIYMPAVSLTHCGEDSSDYRFIISYTYLSCSTDMRAYAGGWVVVAAAVSNVGLFEAEMRYVQLHCPSHHDISMTLNNWSPICSLC